MRLTTRVKTSAFLAAIAMGAISQFASAAMINEIRIDQPGTDNQEYFELSGTPGEALDGLFYVIIGDGTGGSGVVEAVIDLNGEAIPADGYFLGAETSWNTAQPAGFPGGTVDVTFGTLLNFENTDNVTHLLVSEFTGALANDLDTNDDGVLDSTPWTAIIDSVALTTGVAGDLMYSSTIVGPDGAFVPGHIYRLPNHTGNWLIGDFDGAPEFADTPGTPNVPEPATAMLLVMAGTALLAAGRRRAG